jgi:RNA polymerase sigma-70 factor (ECF subfamily)
VPFPIELTLRPSLTLLAQPADVLVEAGRQCIAHAPPIAGIAELAPTNSVTVRASWTQANNVGNAAENLEPTGADFSAIFMKYFDYVWHTLRRLGVRERDLEDVAHDVFLVVLRQFAAYDPNRPARPWLFAFAVRKAADYRRLGRHRVDLLDDTDNACSLRDGAPLPEDQASAREQLDLVARALDTLPWERRVVFILHEIEGTTVPEAAERLGISANTASSRLRLGRDDFAVAVRRLSATGSGKHE